MAIAALKSAVESDRPPLHLSLVATLLAVTAASQHSHEIAVHRLLQDLLEERAAGRIDPAEYLAVIGTAIDVLFFFNYDAASLAAEENIWYRASLIHQMGSGMLQALALLRPELSARPFFQEARAALTLQRSARPSMALAPSPLHCRQWIGRESASSA